MSAVPEGFNDLAITHPEIAKQAHGWDPRKVSRASSKMLAWKCDSGHEWKTSPNTRTRRSIPTGCPVCSNRSVLAGFNDLATTHPEIAKQAHGWNPTEVTAGSAKVCEWKCDRGHVWLSLTNTRTSMMTGCPTCSGRRILVGFNDLATTHPDIAATVHNWNPTTVTAGSRRMHEWKCLVGHIWTARISSRAIGHGCPLCSRNERWGK